MHIAANIYIYIYVRAMKMNLYVVKMDIYPIEMGITAVKWDNSERGDKRFSGVNEH